MASNPLIDDLKKALTMQNEGLYKSCEIISEMVKNADHKKMTDEQAKEARVQLEKLNGAISDFNKAQKEFNNK